MSPRTKQIAVEESPEIKKDSPLIDTSDRTVKSWIRLGKKRGYITYDELNEILKLVAEEKEYDEERLYELGVVYRWMRGEPLDSDETKDLEVYRMKRRKDRCYRNEFKALGTMTIGS